MKILAIGLGYCALQLIRTRGLEKTSLGTTRDPARRDALRRAGLAAALCDGPRRERAVDEALDACETLLVSAAPDAAGDPVLAAFAEALRRSERLKRVVYLSSIGVYGDHAGAWIDEDFAPTPGNERSRERLRAETAWRRFGEETGAPVFVLRLAGIYGPGRNALVQAAQGRARLIVKKGQVFNRIHVEDVARAIAVAIASPRPGGAWNVADDQPTPAADPIRYAAERLGLPSPPEEIFEDAEMTPLARSFWGESKRVSNRRLKDELGVRFAFPTYREGLDALFEAGEGRAPG